MPPNQAINKIAAVIATGGPDSRYLTVEANAVQPWNSLDSFVVQAVHTTAKHIYNDTMHFAGEVKETASGNHTTLHAFSHSQDFIKGNFAYGDHGQNYSCVHECCRTHAPSSRHFTQFTHAPVCAAFLLPENLVLLLGDVFGESIRATEMWTAGNGCPPPSEVL